VRAVGWFCYYAARLITWVLARVLWRVSIEGTENIPTEGAFLLCPVHRSNVDGPLTCILTRRRMRYLAKETMFDIVWLGNVYQAMGAIPVNRGTPDRKSLHTCLSALESGQPLVLFPEGTRQEGDRVTEVHEGAAYLALRAGVPIVPVGIGNSSGAHPKGSWWLRPVKIRIVIGEPFELDKGEASRVSRGAIKEGTEAITVAVQQLFDESEGRVRS
jgi:1-acyl-sn-glycerol-3-phosphate acyltransferase